MAQKKALTKPPKGTRDFLPDEVKKREYVTGIIRQVYEAHGFEPLETPSFERLDTLLGKYGDEGDQLVFKILRRGQQLVDGIRESAVYLGTEGAIVKGRSGETAPGAEKMLADLGLRYDLTVPLARVYADNQGQFTHGLKRYQMQPVWRADNPSKGRFREFWQCDVDVIGADARVAEAEVIGAVSECLQRLGFIDFSIRLNHRGLLRSLVDVVGIAAERETDAIVAIDKLDKVGPEKVQAELEAKGVDAAAAKKLLDIALGDASLDALEAVFRGHEAGLAAVADLRDVVRLAASTPGAKHVRFDPSLARGLGYYTGAIFEVAVPELTGSLGGGGRYDDLIGMFLGEKKSVPACGFSIGLERILVVMDERKMYPDNLTSTDVILAATDKSDLEAALGLAYKLRGDGLRVDLRPKATKPGKLRQQADTRGVGHAVWIQNGMAQLWSRATGDTEKDVAFDALADRIQAR